MNFKRLLFLPLLFILLLLPTKAFASKMSLSGGGTIGIGQTKAVSVRISGAEGINAVSAAVTYPADKLDVTSISYRGSAFGIQAAQRFDGGTVKIERGSFSPVNGNATIATISFKGKALGSAAISFGGSSAYKASDNTNSLSGTNSITFDIVAVIQASETSSTKASQNSSKDTTPPKILDLRVGEISTKSATISWTTDEKADSYIEYGPNSGKYFLNASDSNLKTEHSIRIENTPALQPGIKFFLKVRSKDAADNESVSEEMSFRLKGYKVQVKVLDNKNQPLANTKVILYSDPQEAITDDNGVATFSDVTYGKHVVVVKQENFDQTREIDVKDTFDNQDFSISVPQASTTASSFSLTENKNTVYGAALLVTALLIIVILVIFLRNRRSKNEIKLPPPPTFPPLPPLGQ